MPSAKAVKTELDLKANNSEVIKKADIKTTLDENSTNDDVYGGKAIFDAIKKNCVGKETVLYDGNISATGTYDLADNVNNYDFIVINHTHNSTIYRQSNVLTKSEISKCIDKNNKFLCVYGDGSASIYTTGYFNEDNIIITDYNGEVITSITGYKFGQVTVQNTITNPSPGESYSTDEQLTGGTWIDGKPIYRKVINKTCNIMNGWYDTGITISDIDKLIRSSLVRVKDWCNINDALFKLNSSKIFVLRDELGFSDFYFILEYTKKTD